MREAVGEVAGLDVLHLQCHIGFDSISLARRGARVTGADFSPASLAKGRELAARAGVEVAFVEADATALPRELHGRFDLVYATIGVICWIEDLGGVDAVRAHGAAAGRPARARRDPPALQHDRRARAARCSTSPTPPTARAASRSRAPTRARRRTSRSRPRSSMPTRSGRRWPRRSPRACASTRCTSTSTRTSTRAGTCSARRGTAGSALRVSGERLPVLFTLLASRD